MKLSLEQGTRLFKALSEEARLRILNLLLHQKTLSVSDLELILDFTQTKTSRHMNHLKNAGLVKYSRKDQWIFYSLVDFFEPYLRKEFQHMEGDDQLLKDISVYQILYSNRELAINHLEKKVYRPIIKEDI